MGRLPLQQREITLPINRLMGFLYIRLSPLSTQVAGGCYMYTCRGPDPNHAQFRTGPAQNEILIWPGPDQNFELGWPRMKF